MARPKPKTVKRPPHAGFTPCHRPACHRQLLPCYKRRNRLRPRPIRYRQNRRPAPIGKMGRCRHRRLCRLRRTRKRNDRRLDRVPRAKRPTQRRTPDETLRPDCKHLQHARRGQRGLRLHRHHHRRILPRYGLCRGADGRQHQPMGRSNARNIHPP